MSTIYIVLLTILYFVNSVPILFASQSRGSTNASNSVEISEYLLQTLLDYMGGKTDEINTFKNIIESKSSCVVLIYTISNDKEFDTTKLSIKASSFYNAAIKPRRNKNDYKYGVTSGVIVSNTGIVATTYTGTLNSDRYIVAIDSEKHMEDNVYSEVAVGSNMYEAHVIKSFPELNLVFLQIETTANEKFDYLNLANDSFFRTEQNGKKEFLIYCAVIIGKCKGKNFVRPSLPFNSQNRFDKQTLVVGRIFYLKDKGIPTLFLYTPITGDGALPENHGGAVINSDGKLLGMPVWTDGLTLPYTSAIPASTIKKGLTLAMHNAAEKTSFGLQVDNLSKRQKKVLLKVLENEYRGLNKEFFQKLKDQKVHDTYAQASSLVHSNNLGVIVKSVEINSPAEAANIQAKDILLKIDDDYITDIETFKNLENHSIGMSYVNVTLLRKNKVLNIEMRK